MNTYHRNDISDSLFNNLFIFYNYTSQSTIYDNNNLFKNNVFLDSQLISSFNSFIIFNNTSFENNELFNIKEISDSFVKFNENFIKTMLILAVF